jgi:hypothetical protein
MVAQLVQSNDTLVCADGDKSVAIRKFAVDVRTK